LSISFSESQEYTTYVIPAERSAAFYALGMAEAINEPVAVVCTSGSALLNYYPAVSEAFYRNIPLVVIAADRPKEWIDQGDGQTIRQEGVLKNHIIAETALIESPQNEDELWYNFREIDRLFNSACFTVGGPVHFNMPFNEPLYETIKYEEIEKSLLLSKRSSVISKVNTFAHEEFPNLLTVFNSSLKILVLCGQMPKDNSLQNILDKLSDLPSVAIMVENTSNLVNQKFIHCIDRTINSINDENKLDYIPDLLITLGGAIVSKRIKAFFRLNPPKHHWKVGENNLYMDTFQTYPTVIASKPSIFLKELFSHCLQTNSSRYKEQWKQLDFLIELKHRDFLSANQYSDLAVFDLVLDTIPDGSTLHMGNSSVVRYCQLFDPVSTICHTANRGTSGIDGSLSTAVGYALVKPEQLHVCITGDVSFFYDSNALWNHHLPSNLRIILVNNSGGGIFKIIPGPATTNVLDEVFVTKQGFTAEYICKTFNVHYQKATNLEELEEELYRFYVKNSEQRPVLLEIFTPQNENDKILKAYFKAIKVDDAPVLHTKD
jgi:2-succinyl-5-enolpyruvyl-6-hydroxy-3-cyclohexene-1-carboxylate synthase